MEQDSTEKRATEVILFDKTKADVVFCSKEVSIMTTISAKIENIDKNNFEAICNAIGLNVSSAITAFVKATIRERGIPFELKAADDPYIYSEENMKYLRQGIAQIEGGNGRMHELKEEIR